VPTAVTSSPTTTYATSDGSTDGVCAEDGSSYYYSETITGDGEEIADEDKPAAIRYISTNMCPNHPYTVTAPNPNVPYGVTKTYEVPLYPRVSSTDTDLTEQGGGVGVLFNGAFLYSAYGGTQYGQVTSYETTAAYKEGNTFDQCGCHASSSTGASYHCHVPPSCLLSQLGQDAASHSPQIGWAADGFPVYGPRGKSGTMLQTCTVSGGTYGTDDCTDDCVGAGSATGGEDWIDDGYTYRYYIIGTYDDGLQCTSPSPEGMSSAEYYPMTSNCLKGCIPPGSSSSGFLGTLPDCSDVTAAGGSFKKGVSDTATPTAISTLSQNTAACSNSAMESLLNSASEGIMLELLE
jgi:hypothetical protein